MRSDEETAKAAEEISRTKSDRSLQDTGAGGAKGLAGAGDGLDGFRDKADSSGNECDDVGGPCGAAGSFLEGSCEEIADRLFELLDAQMSLEAAAYLRRHCEMCPHCSELTEAEIHIREIIKRSCCAESAPVNLRMRATNRTAVYRSTTA